MTESSPIKTKSVISEESIIIPHNGAPATQVRYLDAWGHESVALYIDECTYCDDERTNRSTFFPNHFASTRCQSGQRNHCTCDTCF